MAAGLVTTASARGQTSRPEQPSHFHLNACRPQARPDGILTFYSRRLTWRRVAAFPSFSVLEARPERLVMEKEQANAMAGVLYVLSTQFADLGALVITLAEDARASRPQPSRDKMTKADAAG